MNAIKIHDSDDYIDNELWKEEARESGHYDHMTDAKLDDLSMTFMAEDEQEALREVMNEISEAAGCNDLIALGTRRLWHGSYASGFYASDVSELIDRICDGGCEIDALEDRDGDLVIDAVHHDGRNSFVVRALTDEGQSFSDGLEYGDKDDPSVFKDLFDNRSKKLDLAERMGLRAAPTADLAHVAEQAREASETKETTASSKERDVR